MLIEGQNTKTARKWAERLREGVGLANQQAVLEFLIERYEKHHPEPIPTWKEIDGKFSISGGLTSWHPGDSFEEMIDGSDFALRQVKQKLGKNRVRVYNPNQVAG